MKRHTLVTTLRRGVALLCASLGACLAPCPAPAQSTADFYSGKTVTIFVGFGPGGGYDAYAQLLAPHIRRHIPGQPTVIVKHMPGAGSLALMNYLWSVAPRDGTAFGIPASSAAFAPLIGTEQENQLVLANLEMSRPFVAPPDVPDDRLNTLRQAFDRTARDPAFRAAATKAGREISAITATDIGTLLRDAHAMPADIVRRAAEISSGR